MGVGEILIVCLICIPFLGLMWKAAKDKRGTSNVPADSTADQDIAKIRQYAEWDRYSKDKK